MIKFKTAQELPFTTLALHNFATHGHVEKQLLLPPAPPPAAPPAHAPERQERLYESMKFVLVAVLLLFVVGTVILAAITASRVERVLEYVSASESMESVNAILQTLRRSSDNAETASTALVAASRMGAALAEEATPAMRESLNITNGLVHRLQNFATHPSLHVSV